MNILEQYIKHVINEKVQLPYGDVADKIFYWNARESTHVKMGFSVPNAKSRGHDGDERRQLVEEIFEQVRKKIAPDRPSRLSCVYVCPPDKPKCATGRNFKVKVTGTVFYTNQEYFTQAVERFDSIGNLTTSADGKTRDITIDDVRSDITYLAKTYWEGTAYAIVPEVLVDGEVIVVGSGRN